MSESEMTENESKELEKRVTEKIHALFAAQDAEIPKLYESIFRVALQTTIMTIREYEKIRIEQSAQDHPQFFG